MSETGGKRFVHSTNSIIGGYKKIGCPDWWLKTKRVEQDRILSLIKHQPYNANLLRRLKQRTRLTESDAKKFLDWWFYTKEKMDCPDWWTQLGSSDQDKIRKFLHSHGTYNVNLVRKLSQELNIDGIDSEVFLRWWFGEQEKLPKHPPVPPPKPPRKGGEEIYNNYDKILEQDLLLQNKTYDSLDESSQSKIKERIEQFIKAQNMRSNMDLKDEKFDQLYLNLCQEYNLAVEDIDKLVRKIRTELQKDVSKTMEQKKQREEHKKLRDDIIDLKQQQEKYRNSKEDNLIQELEEEIVIKQKRLEQLQEELNKLPYLDAVYHGPLFSFVAILFEYYSKTGKGLDVAEFNFFLEKLLINVPRCICKKIFDAVIQGQSDYMMYNDFIAFLTDPDRYVIFNSEYEVTVNSLPMNVVLEHDSDLSASTMIADVFEKPSAGHILVGSEVLEVNGKNVRNKCPTFIKQTIEQTTLPIRLLLRKEITRRNFNFLKRNHIWLLLEEEIANLRRERRREQDVTEVEFPHCPERDGWQRRIYLTLEDEKYSFLSRIVITGIMFLILFSTCISVIETMPDLRGYSDTFNTIEWIVSLAFTVEYTLKIICVKNMWSFFWDIMSMIDFLAILPFWLSLVLGDYLDKIGGSGSMRVVRVVRLVRIIRLMKNDHFAEYFNEIYITLRNASASFGLLGCVFFLFIVVSASIIYVIESGTKRADGLSYRSDGKESPFPSILSAMYWCIVTITSVGYGDLYPIEAHGQLLAVFVIFNGVMLIALSITVVTSEFTIVHNNQQTSENIQGFHITKYFESVNRIINEVCQKGGRDVSIQYFTETDVRCFINEGMEHKEQLFGLFRHEWAVLPLGVKKKKLFFLTELFGQAEQKTDTRIKYVKERLQEKFLFPSDDTYSTMQLEIDPEPMQTLQRKASNANLPTNVKVEMTSLTNVNTEKVIE